MNAAAAADILGAVDADCDADSDLVATTATVVPRKIPSAEPVLCWIEILS